MAYREKLAWLTFVCMAIAYTLYFSWAAAMPTDSRPIAMVLPFGLITGIQAFIIIAGSIVLSLAARREAQFQADERDRAIARRGATVAYYVLMTGTILVGVIMPFTETAWRIINSALFMVVLAEAVKWVVIILSYRRGWHA